MKVSFSKISHDEAIELLIEKFCNQFKDTNNQDVAILNYKDSRWLVDGENYLAKILQKGNYFVLQVVGRKNRKPYRRQKYYYGTQR